MLCANSFNHLGVNDADFAAPIGLLSVFVKGGLGVLKVPHEPSDFHDVLSVAGSAFASNLSAAC